VTSLRKDAEGQLRLVSDPKFSDEFYERWEHLLEDIEMIELPLKFVREINVNLMDGTVIKFDVSKMILDKLSTREIEYSIEEYLLENDDIVNNIDFHIDVKAVAEEVSGKVSKILDK
jgi:hypothetical protein